LYACFLFDTISACYLTAEVDLEVDLQLVLIYSVALDLLHYPLGLTSKLMIDMSRELQIHTEATVKQDCCW